MTSLSADDLRIGPGDIVMLDADLRIRSATIYVAKDDERWERDGAVVFVRALHVDLERAPEYVTVRTSDVPWGHPSASSYETTIRPPEQLPDHLRHYVMKEPADV